MYSMKNAQLCIDHEPDTEVTCYYMDIRSFGKGFEEFYKTSQEKYGIEFLRGRPAEIIENDDSIRVISTGKLKSINVKTMPYPGFPTDLQPQIVTLLCTASGTSTVTESVWASRFQYIEELKRMGADIIVAGDRAIIHGVESLKGASVKATDLRAGACLAIAGIVAKGTTYVHELRFIDRGYENLEEKLRALGAKVTRVKD